MGENEKNLRGFFTVNNQIIKPISDFEELSFAFDLKPNPKRIMKSDRATIVFWEDGMKTVVKRSADTEDDPYSAFTAALAKKVYGSTNAIKRIIERKTGGQK